MGKIVPAFAIKQRQELPASVATAERLNLQFFQCPGDTLVATGAVESLVRAHPGRFILNVEGTDAAAIFENNPHVSCGNGGRSVRMHNPLISDSDKRPIHFLESYCHQLSQALGIPVPLTTNRPHLYLSEQEKRWIPQVQEVTGQRMPYWVVNSGTKSDYTVKHWGSHNYQRVVDLLRGEVQFVQVGLKHHQHAPLEGAIDLRGRTDTRQLIRLCHHASGGLGGESFLHHVFAALQKPFVLLLSGFVPRTWIDYPTTRVMHKANALSCCDKSKGCCWKNRTTKLNDMDAKNEKLCALPVLSGPEPVPQCLAMISPEEVANAIREFAKYSHG